MSSTTDARRPRLLRLVAAVSGLAMVAAGLTVQPAQAITPLPSLYVSEIAPDVTGVDLYEYIEVTNPGLKPLDLDTVKLTYIYADTADRTKDVPLVVAPGTVVAPGESVVLWLQYKTATLDTATKSVDDFKAYWASKGAPAPQYAVVPVTGQPGMANGGDRGIRISDASGVEISRSFYPAGSVGVDQTAAFDPVAATSTSMALQGLQQATPGTLPAASTTSPAPTTPAPTTPAPTTPAPSTATPTTASPSPTESATPTPTDHCKPNATSPLQITEIMVDSTNVGGADGYEFIEITNVSNMALDWGEYRLEYLYPLADLTNASVAAWPTSPTSVTIAPGKSIVAWIKNAGNTALTAADFNNFYGTSLAAGTQLLEIESSGMANTAARGLQISTSAGTIINRAYYNLAGANDVSSNLALQFATDPADPSRQLLTGSEAGTPGKTTAEQTPLCVAKVSDIDPPSITDATPATIELGQPLVLSATITDNVGVTSVTLWVRTNVESEFRPIEVIVGPDGKVEWTIDAADLTGVRSVDHYWQASDGSQRAFSPIATSTQALPQGDVTLNMVDGQCVKGTTAIIGDTRRGGATLTVDGKDVTDRTRGSLPSAPMFVFEASNVDTFFKNGVLVNGEVLRIFDQGIPSGWETIAAPVPLTHVFKNEMLDVSVYAGTKAKPAIDLNENNDDFQIRGLRLVLPDGRTIRPTNYLDPMRALPMGDSLGRLNFFDAHFEIPASAFTALAYNWDTTSVADGTYPVVLSNVDGAVTRTLCVDNSAPVIESPIADRSTKQGEFTLTATATDAGAGVASVTATLDGEPIELPTETSSVLLPEGNHTLVITAVDKLGNTGTRTLTFYVPEENPVVEISGAAGGADEPCRVNLTAHVTDPTGDDTHLSFRRGTHLMVGKGVTAKAGMTRDAATADRTGATPVDAGALAAVDGAAVTTSSSDALPYQTFEVALPAGTQDSADVRVRWEGTANAGARVVMSVWNTKTSDWERVQDRLADGQPFTLERIVPVANHRTGNAVKVLVQHSVGYAGANLSTSATQVTPHNAADTPRSAYDFTFAWESDTQYYNANDSYYKHQQAIHSYLLDQRDEMNLQYLFHTGDIVDNSTVAHQWENADRAYQMLDQARLPYGVLAGNHDVNHKAVDYGPYGTHFGADRFAANPWFGGQMQNNRGHYDLVSAGGMDFVMLYMGWGPEDQQIAWMNEVIKRFPERKVMINLHEYMLTTGGLGPIPQRIMEQVVAPNPNVITVFSGHYHDAYHRKDRFDDNGDGVPDRTVHSVLFDYQGLPEGGQGYVRLMHFSNATGEIIARTYSPSLDTYNSSDPNLEAEHQDFRISYADLGLKPAVKTLSADAVSADVLTATVLREVPNVGSGNQLTIPLEAEQGFGWYVLATDSHGGMTRSAVQEIALRGCSNRMPAQDPKPSPSATPTPSQSTDVTTTPAPDRGAGAGTTNQTGIDSDQPEEAGASGAGTRSEATSPSRATQPGLARTGGAGLASLTVAVLAVTVGVGIRRRRQ